MVPCLIEKNNSEKSVAQELEEKIQQLKEEAERKKAINRDDELENLRFKNESCVDNSYQLGDIIKCALDIFFDLLIPKNNLLIYENEEKNKYTKYKKQYSLYPFLLVDVVLI